MFSIYISVVLFYIIYIHIFFFQYQLSNTWTLLKLLLLFLLKPEVKSLRLKTLSKALVTDLFLNHCIRRCSPRHYRCYLQALLILLAATWWIDLCSYCILIYMYGRPYLAVSREKIFFLCKQYLLSFGRWEKNKKEATLKHELRVKLNCRTWECFSVFWSRMHPG